MDETKTQSDCIFCKIVSGRIPCTKLFENEHLIAFLDINPAAEGHTLVVPKTHVTRVDKADPQMLAQVALTLPKLAAAIQQATAAEGYNILCNNGAVSGQAVDHLHVHIIPRRSGDGVMKPWPHVNYPPGRMEQVAQTIQNNLPR